MLFTLPCKANGLYFVLLIAIEQIADYLLLCQREPVLGNFVDLASFSHRVMVICSHQKVPQFRSERVKFLNKQENNKKYPKLHWASTRSDKLKPSGPIHKHFPIIFIFPHRLNLEHNIKSINSQKISQSWDLVNTDAEFSSYSKVNIWKVMIKS